MQHVWGEGRTQAGAERREDEREGGGIGVSFAGGGHSGDAGVCLWAVHGATELRVLTVVAFCTAQNGGGVVVSYG